MPAALRALAESGIFEYNPATEVNFFIAADTAPDSGNPRRRKASPSSRAAAENCSRQAVRRRQDEPGPGSSSRSSTQLQQNAARMMDSDTTATACQSSSGSSRTAVRPSQLPEVGVRNSRGEQVVDLVNSDVEGVDLVVIDD